MTQATLESPRTQPAWPRWVAAIAIVATIIAVPIVYFRQVYETEKRLRVVTPGKFYRTGLPSSDVLRRTIREHGIKTVINLMDENPDPAMQKHYLWDKPGTLESQVCAEEGAKFVFISWWGDKGLLPLQTATSENRPEVIDRFLEICDDPNNYPILIHCLAGLHRTGALVAIYRMEYEGMSVAEALNEMRANGYGRKHTMANPYIVEYLYQYKPGLRFKK
jgi:tyrosine-protein phosphatase SIW14